MSKRKTISRTRGKITKRGSQTLAANAKKQQTTNVLRSVFIGLLATVVTFASVAVLSRNVFAEVGVDGRMMPAGIGVEAQLRSDEPQILDMIAVEGDDTVLTMLGIYYLDGRRASVDINFPIWMNNGTTLKFLSEDIKLVTTDLYTEQSFAGLYISEGTTYTEDLIQADWEEFIFILLPNGLYMNVQDMNVRTPLGISTVPSNSILMMTQDYFRYYKLDNSCMAPETIRMSNDMTIVFGEHEYEYFSLLKKLGLFHEEDDPGKEESDISGEGSNISGEISDITGSDSDNESESEFESESIPGRQESDHESGESESGTPHGDHEDSKHESQKPGDNDSDESTDSTGESESGHESEHESGHGHESGHQESHEYSEPESEISGQGEGESGESGESGEGESGGQSSKQGDSGESHDDESGETESGEPSGDSDESEYDPESGSESEGESESQGEPESQMSGGEDSEDEDSDTGDESDDDSKPSETEDSQDHDSEGSGTDDWDDWDDEDEDDESHTRTETEDSGSGEGSGGKKMPYRVPTVSISDFDPWCYAINLNLKVKDRSKAILGGVKIVVWTRLENGSYSGITTEDGYRVFTAKAGKSAVLRRTYNGSDEVTLSIVPPNTTLYIQYTYRYYYETKTMVDGEEVTNRSRLTYESDFYEIKTQPATAENFHDILMKMDTSFAVSDTSFVFTGLKLSNSTDYDPAITESYDNFKKDSLPYINRIEIKLTKVAEKGNPVASGQTVSVKISTSTLNQAKLNETVYKATAGILEPDCLYSFKISASDKYSNTIPLIINSVNYLDYRGEVYTSKAEPKAKITVDENVTDKLTLRIKITDPYGALLPDENDPSRNKDIYLVGEEIGNATQVVIMTGEWRGGRTGKVSCDNQGHVILENPQDGKEYVMMLDSLAFAQSYRFYVYADYLLQPSYPAGETLAICYNESIGDVKCYTASLSSGLLSFGVDFERLTDTSVDMLVHMLSKTTTDILPIVDEFRIKITSDVTKETVFSFNFSLLEYGDKEKSYSDMAYDEEQHGLILQEGDAQTPRILLLGEPEEFAGITPWDSFLITKTYDEVADEDVYSSPTILKVIMPKCLTTSTHYTVTLDTVVLKGGREYPIATSLSNTGFTTRKIAPKINYDTLFIAGSVAEFINYQIYDPDATILNDGLVYAYLYYGDTLMSYKSINASTDINAGIKNLRFDDLIIGGSYTIKLVAAGYNDAEGWTEYHPNYTSATDPEWIIHFTGGSNLYADLTLKEFEYSTTFDNAYDYIILSGEEIARRYIESENGTRTGNAKWTQNTNYCITERFDIPADATFLEVVDYDPETVVYSAMCMRFYDANGKYLTYYYSNLSVTAGYNNSVFNFPAGAVAFDLEFGGSRACLETDGIHIRVHTTPFMDIMHSEDTARYIVAGKSIDSNGALASNGTAYRALYMYPVNPGDVYCVQSDCSSIYYYNAVGAKLFSLSSPSRYRSFVIPQDVHYMSLYFSSNTATYTLCRLSEADHSKGYTVTFDVDAFDNKGYLEQTGSTLTLEIYRALTEELPDYPESFNEKEAESESEAQNSNVSPYEEEESTNELDIEDYLQGEQCYRAPVQLTYVDGRWVYTDNHKTITFNNLKPDNSYMFVLSCDYKGTRVILDTETIRTDGRYVVVDSQFDLFLVQRANFDNFYVVKDLVINHSVQLNNYGLIEFNGHTMTLTTSTYVYGLFYSNYGIIRNLVINIRETRDAEDNVTTLGHPLCYSNYGLIENVIVRTPGDVYISTANSHNLFCYQNLYSGLIRNVEIELNGDMYIKGTCAGFCYANYGFIDSVYMYGVGDAAAILDGQYSSALIYYQDCTFTTLKHCYTNLNLWAYNSDTGACDPAGMMYENYIAANIDGWYHVGDFFSWTGKKVKLAPFGRQHMLYESTVQADVKNTYLISRYAYTNLQAVIKTRDYSALYDIDFQKSVLGDAFDVENCVVMKFYPRLNFPSYMQSEQAYVTLPSLSLNDVTVASDSWATGSEERIQSESGNIVLTLHNPSSTTVGEVEIEGLIVNILRQGPKNDGTDLYDVVLSVSVDPAKPQYVKSYKVTKLIVSNGAYTKTYEPNYQTTGFAFWKPITSAEDWAEMNTHMNWNYRLETDINFAASNLTQSAIMINGNKLKVESTSTFTGALDGNGHTISGIKFLNNRYPYVFYYINNAQSSITNLYVDNIEMEASKISAQYCGFIRSIYNGVIENVHFSNCKFTGTGYIGAIAYMTYGSVTECSIINSTVQDNRGNYTVYAGALSGFNYRGDMLRCFARDVEVNISYSKSSQGVGALCGYMEINNCVDCYAQGKVTTCCDYTGGLVGYASYPMQRCFADVDVITTGSYAGGILGYGTTSNYVDPILACGDVVADGNKINRLVGNRTTLNRYFFAYDKQSVTGFSASDSGDAGNLLSKDALSSLNTWKDWMLFGSAWNYNGLANGCFPKLISKNGGFVPHQTDIPMPGQGGEPTLTYSTSAYDPNQNIYSVALLLEHPSRTYSQIAALIESGAITFDIEGIDMSQSAIESGISKISYGFGVDDYSTQILLEVFKPEQGFLMRKDNYKVIADINFDSHLYELQLSFSFPNVQYWEISSLTEWNNMMSIHGMNTENFLITGIIDFSDQDTAYRNLSLGRLEGVGNAGFTNLKYVSDLSGSPWIENVFRDVTNLSFTNIMANFGPTTDTRGLTGMILVCPGLTNCTFDNLTLTFSKTTTQYVGFISQVRGVIDTVSLSNSTLKVKDNATKVFSYGGILAGYCTGGVLNSTFTDLRIEGGYEQAGCSVGRVYDSATYTSSNNTFTRCYCDSYYNSAPCFGYVYKMSDAVITDCTCVCSYYAGSITGWCRTASNVDMYNCSVTSKSGANGYQYCVSLMCNNSHSPTYTDIVMVNCKVDGTNCNAGLIAGYTYSGSGTFKDCVAIGCSVSSTKGTYADSTNVGGFVGNARIGNTYTSCVIRDTTISGKNHVGGFVGYSTISPRMTFTKCQISEDVTITSANASAGGLIGQSYYFTVSECAVGATIKASNMGCGGFVGNYIPNERNTGVYVTDSIFAGHLEAPDYASAVIGRMESLVIKLTTENVNNVVVMGSVDTQTVKASPWGTSPAESGSCGDFGVFVYDNFLVNGQNIKGVIDSYEVLALDTALMPKSGHFVTASDLADKTKMISYGLSETNWSYDHYGEGNTYLPYPRATVDTAQIAPYADKKIVFTELEGGVHQRVFYPNSEVNVSAGLPLPDGSIYETKLLVYPSAIDSINIEYLPNAVVNVDGKEVTLNENGVVTIAYTYLNPITINSVVYQVSDLARTVMTYNSYWYYIAEDGIHYGNNKDTDARVQAASGNFTEGAVPIHMWGGLVLFSDLSYYTLNAGSAIFDGAVLGTSRDTHAMYSYFTSIGNDSHARVDVYARFTMFGDTRVDKQSFLLTEYNIDGDPIDRYYSPEPTNVPDGVFLLRYRGIDRDHRFLIILSEDGTLHSFLDTAVLGAMEVSGISHISNTFFYGDRVLLARYNDGNVIGVDMLTGETYIDTRTATESFGGAVRNAWNAIFGNPGPNFVYTVDQLPKAERDAIEDIIEAQKQNEPTGGEGTESGLPEGDSGEDKPGTHSGEGTGDDPTAPEEEKIYYSKDKGVYTDNEILYTPDEITREGDDIVVDGKVLFTVRNAGVSSKTEDGETGSDEPGGSSVADGTGKGSTEEGEGMDSVPVAIRRVSHYTLEEIFGDSVMMLNEETQTFEEVEVKDLNERGERKADRASDSKKTDDKKEKKTISEIIEEITISWNAMGTPQKTGYIFIVLVSVAVMTLLIVVTSHFIKKKKVNK